jgi:NAD(P)-dependent dehydrogenase (short-subunit alcohol dehydrogenase family)
LGADVQLDLAGKTAVIVGAAGNLGRAVAAAFERAGATLALVDRSLALLEAGYPQHLKSATALLRPADLLDSAAAAGMCREVHERFGRLDVLFNAVGGLAGGKPVHEEELASWDQLFGINLRAPLNSCRAAVPYMLRQGGGRIVNTAARPAFAGPAHYAAYAASKAALLRLTESLAAELAGAGVTANCIVPGTLDTPQNRAALPGADTSRWVPLDAVADVVLFLASDAARAVSGAAVPVPGRGIA